MKKITLIILILSYSLTSCGILIPFPENKKYPTTTFYVKNNSEKVINFKTSIVKQSMNGPFKMTLPFTVQPKDSVLARKAMFKKNGENPQNWFSEFEIFPVENVKIFDPNKPENWKKWTNKEEKPCYTFIIAE